MHLRRLAFGSLCLSFILAACNSGNSSTPGSGGAPAAMSAAAQRGQRVFSMQCAVCHNANSTAVLHGPGLKGLYKKQELPSGRPANDENVRQTIVNGRNMMPPLGQALDQGQINDVLAYLKTL